MTTWQTDQPGESNDSSITIPTTGSGYHYDVDWDNDGVFDALGLRGSVTHDFGQPGVYTIRIRGDFPRIYFDDSGDSAKILAVNQWGRIQWQSMARAFAGAQHLQLDPYIPDVPDLSQVTDLSGMFAGAKAFNQDISDWDTSHVTTLLNLFNQATAFNQSLCGWDTSQVQIMASVFAHAESFNQNLDCWDTTSVMTMANMFAHARRFNQSLGSWHTANVTTMERMFYGAHAFNQPIGHWGTSRVTNLANMFNQAFAFNQAIGDWDVARVKTMRGMFKAAYSFDQPLANWHLAQVLDLSHMFEEAISFNQAIGDWDTAQVRTLAGMFRGAVSFNQDLAAWDTSQVRSMDSVFRGATSFNQDLSTWHTQQVTTMRDLFYQASAFDQALGDWQLDAISYMGGLFDHSGLSHANYDATLIQWSFQNLPRNVSLTAAGIGHCGLSAETAKSHLINTHAWHIADAGQSCEPSLAQGRDMLVFNRPTLVTEVATIGAIDADLAQELTYTISGKDAADFAIDHAGVLSFKMAADFDRPRDSDRNNVYALQVTVTDNHTVPKSDTVAVFVVIHDVSDGTAPGTPVIADLLNTADSGVFNDDNITQHQHLTLQLMCREAGSTLQLYIGSQQPLNLFCEQAGLKQWPVNQPLPDGIHHITYTETDAAGNQSATAMNLVVTIDRQAPTLKVNQPQRSRPILAGQAEPFSLVEMATRTDATCITSSDHSGQFNCQFNTQTPSRDDYRVYTHDLAGNAVSVSGTLSSKD